MRIYWEYAQYQEAQDGMQGMGKDMEDCVMKLPITGMTKTPCGLSIMAGVDFVSCVYWAATVPEMRAQFTKDTGMSLESILRASPIERMIDKATGHEKNVLAGFADWVCVNVWGEEAQS